MTRFDETDMEILRLLLADGRTPYSAIAEVVDLSPPAVSDRIDRLREEGIVRRVTVDVDRSKLSGADPVLLNVEVSPAAVDDAEAGFREHEAVEHVFTTADARLFVKAFADRGAVRSLLASAVDLDDVRSFDVHMLTDDAWTPGLGASAFDIECAECGNTVTDEGETETLGETRYHFCCPSCATRFTERYEELEEAAG